MGDRNSVVTLAKSWEGRNEADGSHKEIIDIYNSTAPFPRGVRMSYNWAWCATMWSAIAKKLGLTSIMPVEISCGELVKIAKNMGIWVEADSYTPKPGDAVLYDWNDSGSGDNVGWPDHIGIVTYVNATSGYFVTMEGNYDDRVKARTVSLNGKFIRGFITPRYTEKPYEVESPNQSGKDLKTVAHEVIVGQWKNEPERSKLLSEHGYDPKEVQKMVNEILNGAAVVTPNPDQDEYQPVEKVVRSTCAARGFSKAIAGKYKTTANLYCRNDAGTNKKALCLIPKGTIVQCYGYYNQGTGVMWPYIDFVIDGVQYIGFSSKQYLEKVG